MPGDLAGWIPQTGAVGLLLLAVWAVLAGRIVPRVTHEEVRKDRDAYRAAAETALKASGEMSSHVGALTTAVGQLTAAVEQQATTQRETLSIVRQLAGGERSAA
jgi:hypothetical protein